MRRLVILLISQVAIVVALGLVLRSPSVPLGVRGEWEWPHLKVQPAAIDLALATSGLVAYAGFVALGRRVLASPKADGAREWGWVGRLVVAGVFVQVAIQSGAPTGYGLTKWVTLAMPGSSGYYTIARKSMADPWRFWADYPTWIRSQDSLHIGTHPPGLFLAARAASGLMAASPTLARTVDDSLPGSVSDGFRLVLGPLPRTDRAALALMGALTLLACAATAAPLYALARSSGLSAASSWCAAALWPVVPAAILFQPTADTAFPLLSTLALALASRRWVGSAVAAGVVLAVGMQFSLVFLPVGLIAAIVILGRSGETWEDRVFRVAMVGAGFLGLTIGLWAVSNANPFAVWRENQRNHSQFYVQFPRSYLAWQIADLIELAVALGLPATIWAVAGIRRAPRVAWATLAVLAFLALSGKSLSEVARLWLPLMPPLLLASAAGLAAPDPSDDDRPTRAMIAIAATELLLGAQALLLQSLIQVVYPF